MAKRTVSRRDVLQRGSLLAIPAALRPAFASAAESKAAQAVKGLSAGPDVYASIGARPLVNAR
ncbi:MAG TPA: hypothetical protein VIZ31_01200, partial [Vicinamibacteria bacterium]